MKLPDKKIDRFILEETSETRQRLAELEESVINDTKKLNNGEYAENFGLSEMTEQAEVTRWNFVSYLLQCGQSDLQVDTSLENCSTHKALNANVKYILIHTDAY